MLAKPPRRKELTDNPRVDSVDFVYIESTLVGTLSTGLPRRTLKPCDDPIS